MCVWVVCVCGCVCVCGGGGRYLHSRTPGATGNFSTNFKDYP